MTPEQLRPLQKNLSAQPELLGREDYRSTAVLLLLMLLDNEYQFVLQERHPEIPQGGEICFPGGLFDPGQDADTEQTAIRETVEELGITPERITMVGALGTLFTSMATVDAYVGVGGFQGLDELRINSSEVESVFAIPVSRFESGPPQEYQALVRVHPVRLDERTGQETVLFPAAELGLPERYTRPWGANRHRILVYRVDGHTVWGITARLIYEFIRRL
jgi:8-oxo-dGTP pyrophosphatase MutT (NUDIX family)